MFKNLLKSLAQPLVDEALAAAKPALVATINSVADRSGIPVNYLSGFKQQVTIAIMEWRIKL